MAFPRNTMNEVVQANKNAGMCWFSPETKRFWRSRICPTLYTFDTGPGFLPRQFFISSESDYSRTKRLYSIRETRPDGNIDTFGEHQAYRTRAEAVSALKRMARGGEIKGRDSVA